jgi:hypothetical protein
MKPYPFFVKRRTPPAAAGGECKEKRFIKPDV